MAPSSSTQAARPMTVTTPLGKDVLLLLGFTGQEAVSQLFDFELDLLAELEKDIAFDNLLGQKVTINLSMPGGKQRYFSGICNRFSQGRRDEHFIHYRMGIVPQFWLLSKRAQARIFQQITVPDILKKVLQGLDVSFEIQGTFQQRDYCVQYRETDFNFASRLMEEEGIYYFFKHTSSGHTMVVANTPQTHPEMPERSTIVYEEVFGGKRDEDRIIAWEKVQELRSGKCTLWDHTFELPHKHLQADKPIHDTISVGTVKHKLKVGNNDSLEIYDWPGEYAQRFDGVDPGGGARSGDIQKIFEDNARTVEIRMQQEALPGLVIQGRSNCRQFVTGYKFTLDHHFNGNGPYLLTSIQHEANATLDYRSGESGAYNYSNSFTSIPFEQPYRPQRVSPKPFIQGTQTAVVVGPAGEEIFTDKYGRVKVQFHWDRQGKLDANSSCWVRVSQPWAGKRWGASFWPRIGQEVIVDFLEGDADQPIIVGTVYNADQMPPYQGDGLDPKHPNDNKLCGVKSNSTKGGNGFNEWRFDDTAGKEEIFIHAEKDIDIRVKNDRREWIGNDRSLIVHHDKMEHVENDKHIHIDKNHDEKIDENMKLLVGKNQDITIGKTKKESIGDDSHLQIGKGKKESIGDDFSLQIGKGKKESIGDDFSLQIGKGKKESIGDDFSLQIGKGRKESIGQDMSLSVGQSQKIKVGQDASLDIGQNYKQKLGQTLSITVGKDHQETVGKIYALDSGEEINLKGGKKIVIETGQEITIKGPGGFVKIDQSGVIIQGTIVKINSGGSAGEGSSASPDSPDKPDNPDKPDKPENPEKAEEAKPKPPDAADDSVTGFKSAP